MKKILLTAVVAVFGLSSVIAQEESSKGFAKGDIFISGSVSYGSDKVANDKSNVLTVAPQAGFFVSDNIAVGARLGYKSQKSESFNVDVMDIGTFSAGAFGRYYLMPANQFSVFGELSADYTTSDNKLADVKTNGFNVGVAPGISYFVSNHFALEARFGILGYSTSKADTTGAESRDSFNFGLNMSDINFGIVYKF